MSEFRPRAIKVTEFKTETCGRPERDVERREEGTLDYYIVQRYNNCFGHSKSSRSKGMPSVNSEFGYEGHNLPVSFPGTRTGILLSREEIRRGSITVGCGAFLLGCFLDHRSADLKAEPREDETEPWGSRRFEGLRPQHKDVEISSLKTLRE